MSGTVRTGHCLCGAVTLRAAVKGSVLACHCTQCQRWTGGGPLYSADAEDVTVEGEVTLDLYHASGWGERANCPVCGSVLYWRFQGKAIDGVAVGCLDDQSGLTVTREIFVDRRPGWLAPIEGARQLTEAEVEAIMQEHLAGGTE